jgi:hypothetical protein
MDISAHYEPLYRSKLRGINPQRLNRTDLHLIKPARFLS